MSYELCLIGIKKAKKFPGLGGFFSYPVRPGKLGSYKGTGVSTKPL